MGEPSDVRQRGPHLPSTLRTTTTHTPPQLSPSGVNPTIGTVSPPATVNGPARRWAVALDTGGLVFVDSDQLAAE